MGFGGEKMIYNLFFLRQTNDICDFQPLGQKSQPVSDQLNHIQSSGEKPGAQIDQDQCE
jgi:hypothetical protein